MMRLELFLHHLGKFPEIGHDGRREQKSGVLLEFCERHRSLNYHNNGIARKISGLPQPGATLADAVQVGKL
jgi:hypothetical protein